MAIVAGALALVNACATASRPGPALQERAWREYLGTPTRAGGSLESVQADPQPVWRTHVGRGITGVPAIAEDVIAVALVDRKVALLDRVTGELLWRRGIGQHLGPGPLLADDRLFAATQDDRGRVHALRLTDGGTLWTAPSGDVVAPLLLDRDVVIAGSLDGTVTAFAARDGRRRWRASLSGAVRAAPTQVAGGVVVATAADSIFLLDRAGGAVKLRRATHGTVLAAPALAESLLLVGSSLGRLEALDTATLATRWSLDLGDRIVGHVAVRDGRAFALTTDGTLWIVPLGEPAAARRVSTGIVARAGPIPVPGAVLLSAVTGELVLLGNDGRRLWSARLGAPLYEPAIVDQRTIYAASLRGEMVAFR